MDLAARVEQLEALVQEAKSMPLSSSVLMNRDELLELVKEMREALPEEIKQARWVVRDREELLSKAREESEAMVEDAAQEQLRMASRESIVQRAKEEAERLVEEAQEAARKVRLEAEDYVDGKLAQFEIVMVRIMQNLEKIQKAMGRTVSQVEQGREKLRGPAGHPAGILASDEVEEEEAGSPFAVEEEEE